MSGTVEGGRSAVATIKARDPDHYRRIGAMGGKKSRGGGFSKGSEKTRLAGAKGGTERWKRHPYYLKKGETATLLTHQPD